MSFLRKWIGNPVEEQQKQRDYDEAISAEKARANRAITAVYYDSKVMDTMSSALRMMAEGREKDE